MVDRPGHQQCRRPIKAAVPASPEPHRRRRPKRDADDMLEDRPISMPADASARIVADHQGLHEVIRREAGEPGRLLALAAAANQGSGRPARSFPCRSCTASHRRRSGVSRAIPESETVTAPRRRWMRSVPFPRSASRWPRPAPSLEGQAGRTNQIAQQTRFVFAHRPGQQLVHPSDRAAPYGDTLGSVPAEHTGVLFLFPA